VILFLYKVTSHLFSVFCFPLLLFNNRINVISSHLLSLSPSYTVTKNKASLSKLSAAEYPIVSSGVLASNLLCTLLDVTEGDLLEFSKSNVTSLINSKLYMNQLKTKNKKMIVAPPGQKVPETDVDGLGPEGLIEGWVVTEEMALEKLNKNASDSLVLKMLRSDLLIKLTEGIFKYEK
jgi:DNA-binding Xre family transcriptional regulator